MRLVPFIVPTIVAAFTAWWLSPAAPQEPQPASGASPRLAQAGAAATADQELRVAALVKQLGSASYRDRLSAERELSLVGAASRKAVEAAAQSNDAEVRLQAAELLKKFQLDDLWTAGHVSCRGRGESAAKVIAALAEQTGNHLLIGVPYGTFKDGTLDLDYPSGDFWPVLDDICRQTGNRVRTDIDARHRGLLVVGGAPGRFPTAYAGPLRGQITDEQRTFSERIQFGDENRERANTFELDTTLTWEDRLRLVAYRAGPEVVEAVTDTGAKITSLTPGGGRWMMISAGERQISAALKLSPPPASAKQLDRLAVKWTLMAIGEPATLAIDDLDSHQPRRQGDVELSIERVDRHDAERIEIAVLIRRDGPLPDPPEVLYQDYTVELFTADGRACRLQNQSNSLAEGGALLRLAFYADFAQSPARTLRLTYPQLRDQRELTLVFRHVPLPVSRPE
jgi:hypothetical protein